MREHKHLYLRGAAHAHFQIVVGGTKQCCLLAIGCLGGYHTPCFAQIGKHLGTVVLRNHIQCIVGRGNKDVAHSACLHTCNSPHCKHSYHYRFQCLHYNKFFPDVKLLIFHEKNAYFVKNKR